MSALLVFLLAAAWLEDGLLRRFADAYLRRRALVDRMDFALAGLALVACALELAIPFAAPIARQTLHALALALTGFALAAEDAAPSTTCSWRLLRESAPLAVSLALSVAVGLLLLPAESGARGAMLLAAWTIVLVFLRTIAPVLEARIAVARHGVTSMRSARFASVALLALSLLGARAWLP